MFNFNPKNMEKMLRQLGGKVDQMNPIEIRVKFKNKEMVFQNPNLTKIEIKGQEIFQLQGEYKTKAIQKEPDQEDIKLVSEKAQVSEKEARKVLTESEDITEAIMKLKKSK